MSRLLAAMRQLDLERMQAALLADALAEMKKHAIDYRDPRVGFTTHIDRWWRDRRPRG